jgi:2-polyprenyl-3-methyl-5-hydroxy-6-metoxy-1,4-benzoquinol methylase
VPRLVELSIVLMQVSVFKIDKDVMIEFQQPLDPITIKTNLWATLWPSSFLVAEILSKMELKGKQIVDLGCGMGFVSSVAQTKGAQVVGLDYSTDCLSIAQKNNCEVDFIKFNWFHDIPVQLHSRFDIFLGVDILYLRNALGSVAKCIDKMMKLNGISMLVDPGRPNIDEFLARCWELSFVTIVYEKRNHTLQIQPDVTIDLSFVLLVTRSDAAELPSLKAILETLGFTQSNSQHE